MHNCATPNVHCHSVVHERGDNERAKFTNLERHLMKYILLSTLKNDENLLFKFANLTVPYPNSRTTHRRRAHRNRHGGAALMWLQFSMYSSQSPRALHFLCCMVQTIMKLQSQTCICCNKIFDYLTWTPKGWRSCLLVLPCHARKIVRKSGKKPTSVGSKLCVSNELHIAKLEFYSEASSIANVIKFGQLVNC